jgi:hypothetical protein
MTIIQSIQNRIHEIRGHRVMLDFDLAELYEVETKVLNQAVKRNFKRFPEDFMFRLSEEEWREIRATVDDVSQDNSLRSQTVTLKKGRGQHSKYTPYAFTEQGVAMLSGVLNSDKAINMNITIMRAFVAIRRLALSQTNIVTQLQQLKQRIGEHDMQLSSIYDAIENLLDEKVQQNKWEGRERIGFRQQNP